MHMEARKGAPMGHIIVISTPPDRIPPAYASAHAARIVGGMAQKNV